MIDRPYEAIVSRRHFEDTLCPSDHTLGEMNKRVEEEKTEVNMAFVNEVKMKTSNSATARPSLMWRW